MKYAIRCRETGNVIDIFKTKKYAEMALIAYEEGDKMEGYYTPVFYEIKEINK